MNWLECLLIVAGISLDIFAAMECRGALVPKVDKRQLSFSCIIIVLWQLLVLYMGNFVAIISWTDEHKRSGSHLGNILATAILLCLGTRLFLKAKKNEWIHERRQEHFGMLPFIRMIAGTGVYTGLAGVALGLLGSDVPTLLVLIILLNVGFVILGMYTGYHFGFIHKAKAYWIGAILLWIAGIENIVKYFF